MPKMCKFNHLSQAEYFLTHLRATPGWRNNTKRRCKASINQCNWGEQRPAQLQTDARTRSWALPSFGLKVGYTAVSASKDLILRSSYVSNLTSDLTSGKKRLSVRIELCLVRCGRKKDRRISVSCSGARENRCCFIILTMADRYSCGGGMAWSSVSGTAVVLQWEPPGNWLVVPCHDPERVGKQMAGLHLPGLRVAC